METEDKKIKDASMLVRRKLNEQLRETCTQSIERNNIDLRETRERLISSISNILIQNGYSSGVRDVEYYVENIVITRMMEIHHNSIGQKYENFNKLNESFIRDIEKRNQSESKTADEKNAEFQTYLTQSNDKLKAYNELSTKNINMTNAFDDLFKSIAQRSGIYNDPEATEHLKRILNIEKTKAEETLQSEIADVISKSSNNLINSSKNFQSAIYLMEVKQDLLQEASQKSEDSITEYTEVSSKQEFSPKTQQLLDEADSVLKGQTPANEMQELTYVEAQKRTQMLIGMSLSELDEYEKTGLIPQQVQDRYNQSMVNNPQNQEQRRNSR